jgi:YHS domain-containing protein
MESLVYFLLWGGLIFLMMRFGCGSHVMGHGGHGRKQDERSGGGEPRWVPPEKDRDPVCGMTVTTAAAKSTVHGGHVYYFCSQGCRDKFEASPATYVQNPSAQAHGKENAHGSHH